MYVSFDGQATGHDNENRWKEEIYPCTQLIGDIRYVFLATMRGNSGFWIARLLKQHPEYEQHPGLSRYLPNKWLPFLVDTLRRREQFLSEGFASFTQ
jgi:hypothetical protein